MVTKLYKAFAGTLQAYENCIKNGNHEWRDRHRDRLNKLCDHLPRGSGFDDGTKLDLAESTPEKLVFKVDYHHMDEHGFYDGWSCHTVIITPSLVHDFTIKVTGKDRDGIHEVIRDFFSYDLDKNVE